MTAADLIREQWLPVVGYEGYYEVSDQGRIRSLDRVVTRSDRKEVQAPGRLMTGSPSTTNGHVWVRLSRDGTSKGYFLHRLILTAFAGPAAESQEGRHMNDDPLDNTLSNLAWGTRSENADDRVRNGRHHWAMRTHCAEGHEYTTENTYVHPTRGFRTCRTCHRNKAQAWRKSR